MAKKKTKAKKKTIREELKEEMVAKEAMDVDEMVRSQMETAEDAKEYLKAIETDAKKVLGGSVVDVFKARASYRDGKR